MLLENLVKKKLIDPPNYVVSNTQYLVMMGSIAYGVSGDASDIDIYGFTIPSREILFPHLYGYIKGFGTEPQGFDQFQKHHVIDEQENKEYDFSIYSIVKFFDLVMSNNPNLVDALFVPQRCVIHSTQIGNLVRDNRKMFLHKGCWHKFKGYAYSQKNKMKVKNPQVGSKRFDNIQEFGFDVKFAYHIVRLMLEVEQILTTGDLDLECNSEVLKSIRRGEWTMEQICEYFDQKEVNLEDVYDKSTLPYEPDENKIKELLIHCLEIHYGDLSKAVIVPDKASNALQEISKIIREYER
jgi:predicted nucleotidyltransferase